MRVRSEYRALIEAVSETDVARLAAFIDGEGSIFINQRNRLVGRMKSPNFALNMVITNTHVGFINWLKQTFDGSVYFVKYEKCKHLGKKQIIRWQVNEHMAEVILRRCLPYMLIKREQAELALLFRATKNVASNGKCTSYSKLTDEKIEERAQIKAKISALNQSGGAASRIN